MVAIWGLFQLPKVQTYAAKKVSSYYAKKLNTIITIEGLEIKFFDQLDLKELYIEDRNGDTLAYLNNLLIGLDIFDWEGKFLTAKLDLVSPQLYFNRQADSSRYNYHFLIDYFGNESESSNSLEWKLELSELNLTNAAFHFHDYNRPDSSENINYSHIDLHDLNLASSNLVIKENTLNVAIDSLSAKEKNGFELQRLSTKLTIDSANFLFKELSIRTEGSEVNVDLSFTANSFGDYSNFNDLVEMDAYFVNSKVHIDDIAFFAPTLEGIKDQVYLDGEVNGTVSNLSGTNIELQLNQATFLKGDFDLRGLPDVEKTFAHFDLKQLTTNAASIRSLPFPPFKDGRHLELPSSFDSLGTIDFKGNFTGFYNDFVAYGKFSTALGALKTDLALRQDEEGKINYRGNLSTSGFDLGRFFKIKELSTIALNIELDGSGYAFETINATAIGKINELKYKKYNYENIQLNCSFSNETFDGTVMSTDKNLDFLFAGTIDFNKKTPVSKFNLNLNNASLGKLNLFNAQDTATKLRFKADFDLQGKNIDDILGMVRIDSLLYTDSHQNYEVEEFQLKASNTSSDRRISLNSSLLDAWITGQFRVKSIANNLNTFLTHYLPQEKVIEEKTELQDFEFEVEFKKSKPLFRVLLEELEVDSGATLIGEFNNSINEIKLKFKGSKLKYGASYLSDFEININGDEEEITSSIAINSLKLSGINSLDTFQLNTTLKDGENELKIAWESLNKSPNKAVINVTNQLDTYTKMQAQINDSYITINDSIWSFANDSRVSIDSSSVKFSNFHLVNSNQKLALTGGVSRDSSDTLGLKLSKIDLKFISSILPEGSVKLSGIANGEAKVQDVYNRFSLSSDLVLKKLIANNVKIGNADLKSEWKPELKAFLVDANIGEIHEEKLQLRGKVYPLNKENSLDLSLRFNEFPILLLAPYVEDYLTDIQGSLSGKIDVSGEAQKPILAGRLQLQNASLLVNYLNTRYTINDEIIVEPDFIGFNLIEIVDSQGKKAIATGTVFHENYSNFNLDIGLEFDEFLSLNTNSLDNELYYGKAITSGNANISGYADQLIFELDLTAEKGTDFKIPLDEGVDVSTSNFLVFTNSPNFDKKKMEVVDLSGIQLNFDLLIDREAKVQIIFDEQIGDIIKAQGEGSLNLEINTLGNFNIYGQYVVEKGDYLFTLQNVVNKRFDLSKGSRIFWDGSPYDAQIDMNAVYNLRAPLYDLFPENDSNSGYRRRIPVELELQMTNKLLSPNIAFDIKLPTADEETKRKLESILYANNNDVNRQEMNQQVFGLLVLNRFMPSSYGNGDPTEYDRGAPGLNNGYEFLSNQLSNWFSRISDDFDVGLNYRPANELNSEEVDISLSTEVLNDRLILDGNVGYTGNAPQYNPNQNSNFIGEFTAEYKLSSDGRFRVKGFNRSTNNSLLQLNSPYTQGVGLFYREEFDTFGDLFRKYFHSSAK
ncbi:MAG: translocation/assembly module TamB domain-containing protein [Vicingaceae bacterium]